MENNSYYKGINGISSNLNYLSKISQSVLQQYQSTGLTRQINNLAMANQIAGLSVTMNSRLINNITRDSSTSIKMALNNSVSELSKVIKSLSMNYQISEIIKPMNSLVLHSQFKEIAKVMGSFSINTQMGALTSSASKIALQNQVGQISRMIGSLSINNQLAQISKASVGLISINKHFEELKRGMEKFTLESVDIATIVNHENLSDALHNEEDFSSDEASQEIKECYISSLNVNSLEDTINRLYINSQGSHPAIHAFVTNILIPILITIFGMFLQEATVINNNTYIENHTVIINNYYTAEEMFDIQGLNDTSAFNFVTKNETRIYVNKATKSRVIGRMNKGAIIEVIKREGQWTLIEYNSDKVSIQGYVLNKYLARFKRDRKKLQQT